jgi:hypothetical protein
MGWRVQDEADGRARLTGGEVFERRVDMRESTISLSNYVISMKPCVNGEFEASIVESALFLCS